MRCRSTQPVAAQPESGQPSAGPSPASWSDPAPVAGGRPARSGTQLPADVQGKRSGVERRRYRRTRLRRGYMVTVTRELAERIAALAELLLSDDSRTPRCRQLAELSLELIPGSSAAGVVVAGDNAWAYRRLRPEHRRACTAMQLAEPGAGRSPSRCGSARPGGSTTPVPKIAGRCLLGDAGDGLLSCLVLPLRTDREPGGAPGDLRTGAGCFAGAGHDLALLFAAQGGVALRNAALYRNCQAARRQPARRAGVAGSDRAGQGHPRRRVRLLA